MRIAIVCFGALRDNLPPDSDGNRAWIEVPTGTTAQDAAAALGIPERQVYAVLVDGEQADRSAPLAEGVEVTLMPPFSGGS